MPKKILDLEEKEFYATIKRNAKAAMKQLPNIEEEAYERVWFDRSDATRPELKEDQVAQIKEAQEKIITTYNINPEECDDFYHGYWSGILALSRYLMGEINEPDLDCLRTGDGLLDT